ncbi:MxaD family protein [Amycolatopsis antarctica]|uniref:MxaD family protein n=1 Tax=Amycolatopsis antarctica TaxID=1854586 RepID=A0A263D6W6_9PSEU|nr:SRPBCC family protein [Amycolatopsis antarctica]OZM73317.1 MxaD family protein [Amycolatopsis antarctica]
MGRQRARTFSFEVNRVSTASPERLFAMETDAPGWTDWARPLVLISRWERTGEPETAGLGAVRVVGAWPVLLRERTVAYEQDRLHAYSFAADRPLKEYHAEVRFTPNAAGGTDLRWTASFRETVPGTGPGIRLVMRTVISVVSARMVRAAERG